MAGERSLYLVHFRARSRPIGRDSLALAAALALAACNPMTDASTPTPPTAAPAPMSWADLTSRPRPKADAQFRYGPDPYQVVDLWRPAGRGPHPVVLMVHGGCWTTSIADRTLMDWAAADLRARGIAVWNIDYRGVDRPEDGRQATLRDASFASELLRRHAGAQRLDSGRVVAVGHSAGGHLALWLAGQLGPKAILTSRPLPIAHVISLGGLPDLEQAWSEPQGCGRGPIAALVASKEEAAKLDDPAFRREQFAGASVPTLAPLGVPQTLINGDADRIIPTHFAADYAAKMRAAGDKVTVRIVPNQGHVELISPGTPAWAVAVEAIERALGR